MSTLDVELANVSKVFKNTVAVNNVSLGVKKGEFLTLLGPSGSGKTTTLRMVAGFIKPTSGEIYIKGELVNDKPPYERNTGMVFQNYALFPHMTVAENVAFGLKMRKASREEIKRRIKEALDLIRLSGYENRYPNQLSGGEQQRVALARALVIKPDVLLLDEPLSSLDLKLREKMRLEIKLLQRNVEITTMYVTHDQGEALIMSDRLLVMNRGRIVAEGIPSDLYNYPESRFVAEFIGESNFFEGEIMAISKKAEPVILTDDGLTLYASSLRYGNFKEKSMVSVGVRPEKISIVKGDKGSLKNTFIGEVVNISFIGSTIRYHVRLANKHMIVMDLPNMPQTPSCTLGEEVYIKWEPESCILLQRT